MKKIKGFTLVELLVVIAIIGILSAIVMASLSTARNRANDAKIQAQMSSIRAAAEIVYSGNKYGVTTVATANTCGTLVIDPGVSKLMTASNWSNLTSPTCTSNAGANIGSNITSYSMWHALYANGANGWCIDSAGLSAATTVPASGKDCFGNTM